MPTRRHSSRQRRAAWRSDALGKGRIPTPCPGPPCPCVFRLVGACERRPTRGGATRMTDDHTSLTRVPLSTRAWHQGYMAGRRGVMHDCNPFAVATAEALAWNLGWSAGRMKPVRAVVVDDC